MCVRTCLLLNPKPSFSPPSAFAWRASSHYATNYTVRLSIYKHTRPACMLLGPGCAWSQIQLHSSHTIALWLASKMHPTAHCCTWRTSHRCKRDMHHLIIPLHAVADDEDGVSLCILEAQPSDLLLSTAVGALVTMMRCWYNRAAMRRCSGLSILSASLQRCAACLAPGAHPCCSPESCAPLALQSPLLPLPHRTNQKSPGSAAGPLCSACDGTPSLVCSTRGCRHLFAGISFPYFAHNNAVAVIHVMCLPVDLSRWKLSAARSAGCPKPAVCGGLLRVAE